MVSLGFPWFSGDQEYRIDNFNVEAGDVVNPAPPLVDGFALAAAIEGEGSAATSRLVQLAAARSAAPRLERPNAPGDGAMLVGPLYVGSGIEELVRSPQPQHEESVDAVFALLGGDELNRRDE